MWISAKDHFVQIEITVVPNAGRNQIVGELNGRLKIKIQSPPVDGAANAAIIEFLAKTLKTPKKNISILRGETSRQKTIAVLNIELAAAAKILSDYRKD